MSSGVLSKSSINHKQILILLILVLVVITTIYQLRPFLDDEQFSWISIPTYSILPGLLTVYSSVLAIKLHKQKHFQAKAFFFFALGNVCWFIAEQIWQAYDHLWNEDPFPSEADVFFIASYPFMIIFLFLSIKPILKSISRNVWLFSLALSFSFLIPSVLAAYDDMVGEQAFATSIALTYPILSSIQLIPAIIGLLFLSKKGINFSWMLLLSGFIINSIADSFFLFVELDGSYYDGHPVDLIFVYGFILLIFSLHTRLKISNIPNSENYGMLFHENLQYDTIHKFGIPLTLSIICLIVTTILVHSVFIESEESISAQSITFGIVVMLVVFVTIILTINRNLSKLVKIRTNELEKQKNNLEHLVEEKTQELLKSERLSAIGELSGRLAHDMRNPLSVMKMSVDLINQSDGETKISDVKVVERLDLIKKSIDRISHQVDDVLSYVRRSPLKLISVSLSELIQDCIKKINLPDNIKLKFIKNDLQIKCDPVKLEAVIINLIVNAIQEIPNGGNIEIRSFENDEFMVIEFIDSGKGISNESIDKVFEPLFTTKQKGTGLGLASCKNIVEQHLGKISVRNNPTTFTIMIPKELQQISKGSKQS
ncbi:sensor histidine kinase [Nitrosopumilus adriaticus]|uniref:Histidine kinase n=1 Tax=Nitrosopumilus adriaticus TaxID=1580092 RepID=A0A0D5C4S5_9ARCH|nr:ATP-binding protein [Nitrosopumilus adriaticus]AJW71736.1 Histidine kinase [Nitrosopumilus adriaticus]